MKQWFEYFEDIKRRAMSNGYQIYFADESGIRTENHKTWSYAPKGQPPAIKSSGKRLKLNIISAISPSGLMKHMIYLESMTAKLFIKFMNNIIRNSTKKVFLAVGNLKVHHGKLVQAWLKERSNKIELFFLPPYSPELNPDEYLNNIIKNKMQSLPQAHSQDELNSNVHGILKQLQNDHSKVKKIFDHDKIKYAKVETKPKNK